MDFISGLPHTSRGHDGIWVIADHLTKLAYFIPIQITFSAERLAQIYVWETVYLQGSLCLFYQIVVLCLL